MSGGEKEGDEEEGNFVALSIQFTSTFQGQFYTVTLDYLPEPGKPLKSHNGLVKVRNNILRP